MDIWQETLQQDIRELKRGHDLIIEDIRRLQLNDKLQDQDIEMLKGLLAEIKEDTNWIRRKITGAMISAILTAGITGIIGMALAKIFSIN